MNALVAAGLTREELREIRSAAAKRAWAEKRRKFTPEEISEWGRAAYATNDRTRNEEDNRAS